MWFIFYALFVGCADYALKQVEVREAEILVHPTHLDFGHLESGLETDLKSFSIVNTGDENLTIFAPVLVSNNTRFTLETGESSYTIEAGELIEFDVSYIPLTFEENDGWIEIESDDADEPLSIVTLEGYGDAPVMTTSPAEFDYGDISIGCDNEERITIRNDGNLPLIIHSVTQMVTQPADIVMEFGSLPEPPWEIDPSMEVDFLERGLERIHGPREKNGEQGRPALRFPSVPVIECATFKLLLYTNAGV